MLADNLAERLKKGELIEDVLASYDWKDFEMIVEEIFQFHGFATKRNFRFKNEKRYEIDIIAESDSVVFCVDCKRWGRGRQKTYALKKAAEKQMERTEKIASSKKAIPLIITLMDEQVQSQQVYFVPIWKLNEFLNSWEMYF
ncbi:MAG: restriction endonuclease [Candidatus Aenigmarchaeota archaeon]|nr:restriction endonuclease [Candidatus Aenigmarchaeota archaeon]